MTVEYIACIGVIDPFYEKPSPSYRRAAPLHPKFLDNHKFLFYLHSREPFYLKLSKVLDLMVGLAIYIRVLYTILLREIPFAVINEKWPRNIRDDTYIPI